MLRCGSVDADRYPEVFQRIDRAAMTQQRLVEDLLDVTRLTTGKLTMRFERRTIRLTVHDTGEGFERAVKARVRPSP